MNKQFSKFLSLFTLLAALGASAFGQTAITQTTLSSAQGAGVAGLASGDSSTLSTTVSLGSATGVTVASNGQPVTFIYIDQEEEAILTLVTGQTTIFNVLRGVNGTKASPHVSGQMVLISMVSPQFGGGQGSGGFQAGDPPRNGLCTAANTNLTPWINVITGDQWLCSTVTKTWVPGWSNRYALESSGVTAAVASAAGVVLPSGPLFHITGALAITGFTVPVGFDATAEGYGQFCVIPDGTFTTTTAGNIALASTAVVNKLLCWTWDATNSKFIPSY